MARAGLDGADGLQVCEDIESSCESVMNGSANEIMGIGACDAPTAAAIKARIGYRRAVHRSC